MRRGRITTYARRKRNPILQARCGACGHCERYSGWDKARAVEKIHAAGWDYSGDFGVCCPACLVFLRAIR